MLNIHVTVKATPTFELYQDARRYKESSPYLIPSSITMRDMYHENGSYTMLITRRHRIETFFPNESHGGFIPLFFRTNNLEKKKKGNKISNKKKKKKKKSRRFIKNLKLLKLKKKKKSDTGVTEALKNKEEKDNRNCYSVTFIQHPPWICPREKIIIVTKKRNR